MYVLQSHRDQHDGHAARAGQEGPRLAKLAYPNHRLRGRVGHARPSLGPPGLPTLDAALHRPGPHPLREGREILEASQAQAATRTRQFADALNKHLPFKDVHRCKMTIQISREVLNDIIEALTQVRRVSGAHDGRRRRQRRLHPNEEMQLCTLCRAQLSRCCLWLAPMNAAVRQDQARKRVRRIRARSMTCWRSSDEPGSHRTAGGRLLRRRPPDLPPHHHPSEKDHVHDQRSRLQRLRHHPEPVFQVRRRVPGRK